MFGFVLGFAVVSLPELQRMPPKLRAVVVVRNTSAVEVTLGEGEVKVKESEGRAVVKAIADRGEDEPEEMSQWAVLEAEVAEEKARLARLGAGEVEEKVRLEVEEAAEAADGLLAPAPATHCAVAQCWYDQRLLPQERAKARRGSRRALLETQSAQAREVPRAIDSGHW